MPSFLVLWGLGGHCYTAKCSHVARETAAGSSVDDMSCGGGGGSGGGDSEIMERKKRFVTSAPFILCCFRF